MNTAGHQLFLNCLETLQRALKGETPNWTQMRSFQLVIALRFMHAGMTDLQMVVETRLTLLKDFKFQCTTSIFFFLVSSLPSMTDRLESIARQNM